MLPPWPPRRKAHLNVKAHMDITGTRWTFHLQQEHQRVRHSRYQRRRHYNTPAT